MLAETEAAIAVRLTETEEKIAQQLAEAEAEQKAWAEEKELIAQTHEVKGERVSLDVRGHIYATKLSTFSSAAAQGTMLNALFSGRHELDQQENGAVFLDRDPVSFRYILNYLSSPSSFVAPTLECERKQLVMEAQYYAMPQSFFGTSREEIKELVELYDSYDSECTITSSKGDIEGEKAKLLVGAGGRVLHFDGKTTGHLTFTFTKSVEFTAVQVKRGKGMTFDIEYKDSKTGSWIKTNQMFLNDEAWNPKTSWSPRSASVWRLNLKKNTATEWFEAIRWYLPPNSTVVIKHWTSHSWCDKYLNSKGEIIAS